MRLHWSVIAVTALVLASCSKEDAGRGGMMPISIGADTQEMDTKAANEITINELRNTAHFGVFASYTGSVPYEQTSVVPDFMYNQEVTWSGGHWDYSPLKYWPNDEGYVSFFAYAPYVADPSTHNCIIGFSPKSEQGDPWLTYRLAATPAQQVDLLYGINQSAGKSWLDCQKPAVNVKTPDFRFQHALACFAETISIKGESELLTRLSGVGEVRVNSVTVHFINLTAKGRLILNSTTIPNWKPIISGDVAVSRSITVNVGSYTLTTSPHQLATGSGVFYIPLHLDGRPKQQAYVTVDYTLHLTASNTDKPGVTQSAPFDLNGNAGERAGLEITITKDLEVLSRVLTTNPLTGILPGSQTVESI